PDRLLQKGQVFAGKAEVEVKTDKFLVEAVGAQEEPALEGKAKVVFRGTVRFNYPVAPETLAPPIRLGDPTPPRPGTAPLETSWRSGSIVYRTEAVQKQKDERKLQLVIASDLTPAEGNAPLGEDYSKEIELGSSTRLAVRAYEAQPGLHE